MAESRPQLALSSIALLLLTSSISVVSGQSSGVFISLNGVNVPNDSYVLVSNIDVGDNGLLCNTDRSDCCRGGDHPNGTAQGHWYRPDGTEVMSFTTEFAANPTQNFFSRSRGTGMVRLNRSRNPPQSQRGRFRCMIPDASGMDVTLFVNIVDMIPTTQPPPPTTQPPPPTTTQSPPPTTTRPATTTQPSTTPPPPDTTAPPATTVPLPPTSIVIMVSIEPSGDDTVGGSYRLVCSVTVTGSTDTPTITWMDPMNNRITSGVMTTGSMSTLTFNPLAASHAGVYTCRATLGSAMDTASRTITLQVPSPTVTLSSVPTGTIAAGSIVTLTCTVTMNQAVRESDLSWLMVEARLTRPDGTMLSLLNPVISGTTFTFTTRLSPFGRSDAGNYMCRATVRPQTSVSSYLTASNTVTSQPLSFVYSSVYLSLLGRAYTTNNSYILITDFGEGDERGLLCFTDLAQCCGRNQGEWIFPNGSLVRVNGVGDDFYRSRGSHVVRLNRRNNPTSPTGLYCCEVPDATTNTQRVCANIVLGLPTTSAPIQVNTAIIVNYQVLSTNINFSLTCNSSGGPASNVIWTRDGFLLDNTGPLVLTDASTFSYTNILVVGGRIPGTYTCQIRGPDDQVLSSTSISVHGSAPPVNVQATQSSSSAPVEVSWSPPSDGATNITGYRIFYGSGQSFLARSYVTRIIFNFVESPSDVGPTVSIRSESMQLPSELISVTVTIADKQLSSEALRTSSSEVGIAVGVLILAEGFIAVVIAIIVIISWLIVRKRKSGKNDFAVSANMAYGQVKLDTVGERGGEYEDPDKLARSAGRRQGDYELTETPAPYEFPVSKPEAPVYATADETTTRGKTT